MPTKKHLPPNTAPADSRRDLLTREEASVYLRVPLGTLDNWRSGRTVRLPFYKVGGRVFYKRLELDAFLERCRIA